MNASTVDDSARHEDLAEPPQWKVRLALLATLLGIVVLRLLCLDQPIVENYVGRQVPTAMVARNLDRGSGFLRPLLDTAPFPNFFLVEPPLYELAVVALRRIAGWRLEACGRIVSAFATALGGWGLFGLIRRREGEQVALAAVIAFSLFPVTIRYGRAFQPDALMLGAVLAGLNCWDRAEGGRGRWWLVAGWLLLVLGFAAKVTAALVLIPLSVAIMRRRTTAELLVCRHRAGAGATLVCLGQSSDRIEWRLPSLGGESRDLDDSAWHFGPRESGDFVASLAIPCHPGLHPAWPCPWHLGPLPPTKQSGVSGLVEGLGADGGCDDGAPGGQAPS